MASRHEIISIDFRANASKANPAMESLRKAAYDLRNEITDTEGKLNEAFKTGKAQTEIDNLTTKLNGQKKELKSFETAITSLEKGVSTLSRAIDAFNKGSLNEMSAAFQKASYNAAENAKKALLPGSKDYEKNMAELDALQQKNLENLAKYKLRVEQMFDSQGKLVGKASSGDLKREADGIRELMAILPHMGHEWHEYNQLLKLVTDETQRQADAEKRLKGEMVDAADAREQAKKLTREGAEAAELAARAAEQEIEALKQEKQALKDAREEKEREIGKTRELVAERERALKKQEKTVTKLEQEIEAGRNLAEDEHGQIKVSRQNADTLREMAQQEAENLKLQKERTKVVADEVQGLKDKLAQLNTQQQQAPKTDPATDAIKQGAEAAGQSVDALKQKLENVQASAAKYAEEAKFNPTFYKGRETPEKEIAYEREQIATYRQRIADLGDIDAKRRGMIEAGQRKSGLKKAEYDYFKAEQEAIDFFGNFKAKAADAKKEFGGIVSEMKELKTHGLEFDELFESKNVAEFYQRLQNLVHLFQGLGKDVAMNLRPDGTFPEYSKLQAWLEGQLNTVEELKESYRTTVEAARGLKKHSDAYLDLTQAEVTQHDNESYIAISEKRIGILEKLVGAQKEEKQLTEQLTAAQQQGTQATDKLTEAQADGNTTSEEELKLKEQLAQKEQELTQEKANEQRMEQELADTKEKAKTADEEANKLEKEYVDTLQDKEGKLEHEKTLLNEKNGLLGEANRQLEGQQKQLNDIGKAQDDNARKTADAEQRKQQNQALTIKNMEDMLSLYKKEYAETAKSEEERAKLKAEIEGIEAALRKAKGGFESADEVLQRFNEHMNAGKTASEGMAQTLEEKLAGSTSSVDKSIEDTIEMIRFFEDEVKTDKEMIASLEEDIELYEKKLKSWNPLQQISNKVNRNAEWLAELKSRLEGDGTDENYGWKKGLKNDEDGLDFYKKRLEELKKQKAEELGLNEQEVTAEQKKQQAQKLTQQQMQEGIKLLEEEFAATDHTTEEGIKKREKLRTAIDQMNQEIKESTGEWMSYGEAQQFAAKAGGEGFIATAQQMQKATQALERHRDTLIKTIQLKQKDGKDTKDEEAQLKKVEAELKKIKFEMDNAGMSAKRMEEILENPRSAKNIEELGMAVKRSQAQLKLMEDTIGKGNAQYDELAKKTQLAAQRQKELEAQFKASASSFEKAWSRLKTYVTLYVSAAAAIQKLTGSVGDLMELSDKMGEVRKTTGFTADEVAHLSENLKKLDVRTNLVNLMDISAKAGQLGLKTIEDVQGFTEAANKLMIALPEMGTEAATEMMRVAIATGEVDKIRKQIQEGTIEGTNETAVAMEKIASTIDRLRASSASTAPEITDFVKRLGAVGAQSGISIDQISALGSTVSSLGMRVEMSATALSRMIPAIKNNAFEVAKAIKVEPAVLRNLFETGRGMEAILMIFQHIKDAGMDEDSVEKLLGMAGMQDVMKQLNQQGARAGIVFAGLSQNVDELRKQLGVAAQAYEENVAIQQEFDRMNETTAAKWERFKNEIEEAFVRDEMQRGLGFIIDGLRTIVNLLTGNVTPALQIITGLFHTFLAYYGVLKLGLGEGIMKAVAGFKSMGEGIRGLTNNTKEYIRLSKQLRAEKAALAAATDAETKAMHAHNIEVIKAEKAQKGLNKAMLANIWAAVVAAIIAASFALYNWIQNMREAAREAGRFEAEAQKNTRAANKMIDAIGKARMKFEDAEVAVRKARKELEEAKKANDGTAEAAKRLKDAETELLVQEEKKRLAMAEHKRMIEQFNTQYSKYLGFMLSEVSSNIELAKARDLVNSKLRETITLKQREAGLERVEKNMGEKRDERYGNLQSLVYGRIKDPTKAARVMKELTEAAQKFDNVAIDKTLDKYGIKFGQMQQAAWDYRKELENINEANKRVVDQAESQLGLDRETSQKNLVSQVNEAFRTYNKHLSTYKGAEGDKRAQAAAAVLQQIDQLREMQQSASSYYKMDDKKEETRYKNQMRGLIGWQGYSRDELLKAAGKYYTPRKDINGELTSGFKDETNGGWGASHEASSTDWKNMSAEQLVNRRKQMKDFVNAIQTDSDVQTVLGEDAALKKAIKKGMASDMRTVIEWYNTERLKIQDELNARHLTNTGDWKDPKQERARKKRLQDDMKAYLEELDAYYTERKAKIQEARNEEEISEAEAWNRDIKNEAEWRRRRAELQKMYADKGVEVTQEAQDAILAILAERTEDDVNFIRKTIDKTVQFSKAIRDMNEQGAKEYRKFQGDLQLGWEKDYLKQRQALGKHLKAIEDIVNKERPFSGIVKTMQDNLGKMGILTADLGDDAESAADELKRLTFLMEEAEGAYTMTVEKLLEDMRQKGFKEWADVISKDPSMQQGMLAMLRMTFDSVQDAIKKESSIIKKQVEIMMQDITDQAQADDTRLQILQNSVSRANSLIGAGAASERVADKLAIKQIQMQITLQETRIRMLQKRGADQVALLNQEADLLEKQGKIEEARQKRMDAENVDKSVGLTLTKEQVELDKQRVALSEKLEESQNRLYTQLKEWADLLSSSVLGVMEASNAGNAEYYNELAKLNLTGKGGPGAGTYIVIENEGTSDAKAHYEYLDERRALERQREIERQNAQADAWKKVMDDLNAKMNEQVTDWINAMYQNAAVDANTRELSKFQSELKKEQSKLNENTNVTKGNTDVSEKSVEALSSNTEAILGLTAALTGKEPETNTPEAKGIIKDTPSAGGISDHATNTGTEFAFDKQANYSQAPVEPVAAPRITMPESTGDFATDRLNYYNAIGEAARQAYQAEIEASNAARDAVIENEKQKSQAAQDASDQKTQKVTENSNKEKQTETNNNRTELASGTSMYAKLTAAANLYGIAYQTMSNDNLSSAQKFQMFALQSAGQAAIGMLTTNLFQAEGDNMVQLPGILGKLLGQMPYPAAMATFAAVTALLGGLMDMAVSKVSKSKSQIAQVTGSSVNAGRLSTGMMTYAKGNVNELTDPDTLTPGRSYNVDGADGRTYRAKYTGKNAKTHITSGPEFHLVGEKGQEAIIDAHTTKLIRMNDTGIWQDIQTLYNGGRLSAVRRRKGRGVRAFAEGNLDDFEDIAGMADGSAASGAFSPEMAQQMQASLDRNSEVMERVLAEGIHAYFDVYGKNGLIDSYDTGKKTVTRHGEKY